MVELNWRRLIRITRILRLIWLRSQRSLGILLVTTRLARGRITLWISLLGWRLINLLRRIILRWPRLVWSIIGSLVRLSVGLLRCRIVLLSRRSLLSCYNNIRNRLISWCWISLSGSWRSRLSCLGRSICILSCIPITSEWWWLICNRSITTAWTNWLLNISSWRIVRLEILWLSSTLRIIIARLITIRTIWLVLLANRIRRVSIIRIGVICTRYWLMTVPLSGIRLIGRLLIVYIYSARTACLTSANSTTLCSGKILIGLSLVLKRSILLREWSWNVKNKSMYT